MPSPRAKTNVVDIDFDEFLLRGASAKGKRLSNRTVRRVYETTEKMQAEKKQNLVLPGLAEETKDQPLEKDYSDDQESGQEDQE